MSVGVLLITHSGVGAALLASAERVLRNLPLAAGSFEVPFDADLDAILPAASAAMRRVDSGDGVLLLTDLYGASPSNLAARLAQLGSPTRRVAGLNLPMLLRVMNYPEQALDALQATASLGGRNGVLLDDPV
ncbi:PTS sugar transporter subunit IIA [Luteimonas sp. e5]